MAKKLNKVVEILMSRDGLTQAEAEHHLNYVREMLDDVITEGSYDEAEDIIASELGLEMDYIFDILNY